MSGSIAHFYANMTQRERLIARMVCRGFRNRQIALCLAVSGETVKTHISHILRKCGVRQRSQLRRMLMDE